MSGNHRNAGKVNMKLLQFIRDVGTFLNKAFRMAKPYWQSEHKVEAWRNLSGFSVIEVVQVYILVEMSYALANFMDVLDARDFSDIWVKCGIWFGFVMLYLALNYIQTHFRYMLMIGWRQFLTKRYFDQYMQPTIYHQMELKDYDVDNPDQRLSMDMYNFTFQTLESGVGFVSQTIKAVAFGFVLWDVSSSLEFTFQGIDVVIPGYMFWAALMYAAVVIFATHKVGKPLIKLNFERQKVEADFRYQLVRIRENGEGIALLEGENAERKAVWQRFDSIKENWIDLLVYRKRLIIVNETLSNLSSIFPYLVAMPAFMAGSIALGGLLQLRMAFLRVETALTWIASAYEQVAEWKASTDRILTLEKGLQAAKLERKDCKLHVALNDKNELLVDDLSIDLPNGDKLTQNLNLTLRHGQNMVVTGTSGSGKSTLFRAISGLWVWGKGSVYTPEKNIMFLPQRPYLPIGTLRDVLLYPSQSATVSDVRLKRLMDLCLLSKFTERLNENTDWGKILSGGEQQRVSFVRALLMQPSWLFLDEATAALDPSTEAKIYGLLSSELPDTTIVSIAHRETLKKYHSHELHINSKDQSYRFAPIGG